MTKIETGFLRGKKGLVLGVVNDKSIAFAVAKAITDNGGTVALNHIKPEYKGRIDAVGAQLGVTENLYINVLEPQSMVDAVAHLEKTWGTVDFFIHSIAFSDKSELRGMYIDTTLDNFLNAMNVSCYSMTYMSKLLMPLMKENGGSIITMSYYGAEKVVPGYNVMGLCKAALEASVRYAATDLGKYNIRVNAISAGTIRTLASSAIGSFGHIHEWSAVNSPMRRSVTQEEVAGMALALVTREFSGGVTGQTIYVDCGSSIIGIPSNE